MTLEEAYEYGGRVEITFKEGYGWVTGRGPLEIVRGRVGKSRGITPVYDQFILLRRIDSWYGYTLYQEDIVSIRRV